MGIPSSPSKPPLDKLPTFRLTELEKARLAMMIDCEGSLGVTKKRIGKRYSPYIYIVNTNLNLVRFFHRLTSCKAKISEVDDKRHLGWKRIYRIKTDSMPFIYHLLNQIKPYLIAKKKQARLVIKFIKIQDDRTRKVKLRRELLNYTPKQHWIVEKLALLNKRGRWVYP